MKQLTLAICLLPFFLSGRVESAAAESLGQATPPPIPKVMVLTPGGRPVWVDASRVMTASGEIDTNVIAPDNASSIRRLLNLPATSGCIEDGPAIFDELVILGQPPPNLAALPMP